MSVLEQVQADVRIAMKAGEGERVEFDFDGGHLAFELADLDRAIAAMVPQRPTDGARRAAALIADLI